MLWGCLGLLGMVGGCGGYRATYGTALLLGGVAGMTSISDRTTRWAGVVWAYQRGGRDGYAVVVIMLSSAIWPYLALLHCLSPYFHSHFTVAAL